MPLTIRVQVIALGTDSDPFTGAGYTSVTFAVQSHIATPPQLANVYPPVPRPSVHKHIMHLYFPTTQWNDQYKMWNEYDLTIQDNGELSLNLAHERVEAGQ